MNRIKAKINRSIKKETAKDKLNRNLLETMPSFKKIELTDYEQITSLTNKSDCMACAISFCNLFCWQEVLGIEWMECEGCLFIKQIMNAQPCLFLASNCDRQAVITLLKLIKESDPQTKIICTSYQKELFDSYFPQTFQFIENKELEDISDYIYLRTNLATLGGIRQKKKNHVNKFIKSYNYSTEPITRKNIAECVDFEKQWYLTRGFYHKFDSGENAYLTALKELQNIDELHLTGFLIRVDGRVAAITLGQAINNQVWDVIIACADTSYSGIYSMLFYELANKIPTTFEYLNFEEDCGVEGLRKMKLSYHPDIILKKLFAQTTP